MNTSHVALGAAVIALMLGGAAFFSPPEQSFGGQLYEYEQKHFFEGLYAGSDDQFEVNAAGAISLTAPTFCMDFHATSTATLNRMVASSTATIEGMDGVMLMQYGACP